MSGRCHAGGAWTFVRNRGLLALTAFAVLATAAIALSSAEARPRDKDGDGLTNRHERKRSHTNPRRADTDRDRLRDRFELRRSHTNPRRADTDGDGLRDRFELRKSHTNPRRRDTDGDGVSDRRELRRGTNPRRKPRRKRRVTPSPPAVSSFPTAATTGVPNGWQPARTHNGTLTVSQPGTVIDGWLVTGTIAVRAPNVTIRNSRVYQSIFNQSSNRVYNGLLVEDTEIGPDSGNNNETNGSLGVGGYTARRVHIHNSTEGFRVGGYNNSGGEAGPVTIENSFVDLDSTSACAHSDGVQGYDEPRGILIHHNTIDMRGVRCSTAPIYIGNDNPGTKTVTNNLIMGGSYTLRLHNEGSGISYPQVTGNRLVNGAWDYGPVLVDSCSVIGTWADNRLVSIDAGYNVTSLGATINRC